MEYSTRNIFKLENPQAYSCEILSYHRQHSDLFLKANHLSNPDKYWFEFTALEYFEGPVGWRGADFCIATTDECIKLLRNLKLDINLYLETYSLFVVLASSGFEVKMLAQRANVVKYPPKLSSGLIERDKAD